MSEQKFYHGSFVPNAGYSEYELEALRIPNQMRGECLPFYVPYVKCMLNANPIARWVGRCCQEEKSPFFNCRMIQRNRATSKHLMRMKLNNPEKFEELNVAPALDSQYSPSFLNLTRH